MNKTFQKCNVIKIPTENLLAEVGRRPTGKT